MIADRGRWEREESSIGTWILIQELWEELGQDMDIQGYRKSIPARGDSMKKHIGGGKYKVFLGETTNDLSHSTHLALVLGKMERCGPCLQEVLM